MRNKIGFDELALAQVNHTQGRRTRLEPRGEDDQFNWYASYSKGDFSLAITNDAWLSGDEYRTAAVEIGVREFSLGFNLYTTSPPDSEHESGKGLDPNYSSPIYGKPKYGTYTSGSRISAALYLGYRNSNNVSRIGIDAPWVQDIFQNGMHVLIGSPFFNTNYGSPSSIFMQSGYNFPYSLYPY